MSKSSQNLHKTCLSTSKKKSFPLKKLPTLLKYFIPNPQKPPNITPTEPKSPPRNVRGTAIGKNQLRISWRAPSSDSKKIVGYHVYYVIKMGQSQKKKEKDAIVKTVSRDQTTVLLSGLETWTTYEVWVKAYTSMGDGPSSEVISLRTEEDGR